MSAGPCVTRAIEWVLPGPARDMHAAQAEAPTGIEPVKSAGQALEPILERLWASTALRELARGTA
jgi:hypothetical protein